MEDIRLEIKGKGFTDIFEGNFIKIKYTSNILLDDTLDLDTLDVELARTKIDFEKYYNSLGNIEATLFLGDYKTKFFHITQIHPRGFSTTSITDPSIRMTTFPKKTAKIFDKDFLIYQEKSLFKIFEKIMKDNDIPSDAYELVGEDTELPLNEIKDQGISQLEFLRQLCFAYGYGIISRDGKIRLIDLDSVKDGDSVQKIDFDNITDNYGLSGLNAHLDLQPMLEFIQIARNDPSKLYFKSGSYKNNAYFRDIYNKDSEYVSVNGVVPLTTVQKKVNTLFRVAQQKTRQLTLSYSKLIPIFAGSVVEVTNYDPFFDRFYLVKSSTFMLSGDRISCDLSLIQNYNSQKFNVTFEQFIE